MSWREDAEERLPRPLPGEPKTLRADILDELADHLGEAMARERRGGAVEDAVAWERAVHRFGDPTRIALQLWWQAMGERIMRERLQIGLLVVLVVAVLGMAGVLFRQSQETTATLSALKTALERNAPNEYRMVEIQLTRDGPTSAPAAGVNVRLHGAAFGSVETTLAGTSDSSGKLSFGPIHSGRFSLDLNDSFLYTNTDFVLYPGNEPKVVTIHAPAPSPTNIEFTHDFPAEGAFEYQAILECQYEPQGEVWQFSCCLVVKPNGTGYLKEPGRDNSPFYEDGVFRRRGRPIPEAEVPLPATPVRPDGEAGDARHIELPPLTSIKVTAFQINVNGSRFSEIESKEFAVSAGTVNKLSYNIGDELKEDWKRYNEDQAERRKMESEQPPAVPVISPQQ